MSWLDYVGVSLGVAISLLASACALGRGLLGLSPRQAIQLSWRFALLQFVLLAAGWLAGTEAANAIGQWSCWVAKLAMAFVAIKMLRPRRANHSPPETSGPDVLVVLLAATNSIRIHALVLGVVLSLLGSRSVVGAMVAAMLAAVLTVVGIAIGSRSGLRIAGSIQAAGGCVLLLIVARGLLSHLYG